VKSSDGGAKRAKQGRGRSGDLTRKRILAASERLFAKHGFDGVSMRALAAAADAQLALLHYHFGNKPDLYRAIWVHRFEQPVMKQFIAGWSNLKPQGSVRQVVRELVERFVANPHVLTEQFGSRDFLVIIGRESSDPKRAERGLMREFVYPVQRAIEATFAAALPHLSAKEIAFRCAFMTGTMQASLPSGETIPGVAGASRKSKLARSFQAAAIDYIVAGWLQPHTTKQQGRCDPPASCAAKRSASA
jgi:AcrR family transcriptional regulator